MSYDLTFWKQKPSCKKPPAEVYARLMDGLIVEELESLPVEAISSMIEQQFPGVIHAQGLTYWEGDSRGMFEIYLSEQHIHFCCRQMGGDDMNSLIDIGSAFSCPLYDPQEDVRFDGCSTERQPEGEQGADGNPH